MSEQGMVFDIQRYSVHDGPGIRTTVFLKGCNLRCFWCHNPESYRREPDLLFYPNKCINCGKCFRLCPLNCHSVDNAGAHQINRAACTACGVCSQKCYAGALVISGKWRSVEDVMQTVLADAVFYKNSGGGMTVSGGEPMMQPEFTLALLQAAKEAGLQTALDTAANYDYALLERAAPWADLFLVDCKCMDNALHKQATGVENIRILENLARMGQGAVPVWVRVPVVPGVNDSVQNMEALREFLVGLPAIAKMELLPYHNLGLSKHESLGRDYGYRELKAPSKEHMEALAAVFAGQEYAVTTG